MTNPIRFDVLNQMARLVSGFHVRPELVYDYENARLRMIFEALTQGVCYVYNNPVEGDIAEFGTGMGFSAVTLSKAMAEYQRVFGEHLRRSGLDSKTLYLFDSFQGLPPPTDPVDVDSPTVKSGRWSEGAYRGLSPEELAELCAPFYDRSQLRVMEGWFSKTLRQVPPTTRFAMVHLDCDLYASTIEVLDYLFGQRFVVDGCAIYFDDWNCNRSSPRFGQRRAWLETVEKYRLRFSDCGDYAVLGHKFVIHTGS